MTLEVDVQIACEGDDLPGQPEIREWARAAIGDSRDRAEVTVRIVDEAEGARLNSRFRHRDGATNVLSFPFEAPASVGVPLLGDIVICAPVVRREAMEQSKSERSHWAHMVVHGALHLVGFAHDDDDEARTMEAEERRILANLGFDDPYESRGTP